MIGFTPIEIGVLSLVGGASLWASRRYISVRGVLRFAAVLLFVAATAIATLGTGQPAANGYLLVCWRGEGHDYFASWSRASTLVFDQARYYRFGGPLYDAAAWLAIASGLWVAGELLWRWAERFAPVG